MRPSLWHSRRGSRALFEGNNATVPLFYFELIIRYLTRGFCPEPTNFFKFFSSEWFKVIFLSWCWRNFGFQFSLLNPGKKSWNSDGYGWRYAKAFWRKLGTHFWHVLRTLSPSIDCCIGQIKTAPANTFICTFYPHGHFVTDLDRFWFF